MIEILDEYNLPEEIELKAQNASRIYNERFEKLVALYPYGRDNEGRILWVCKCDCGNYCGVAAKKLKQKTKPIRSCGCLRIERVREVQGKFKNGDIIGGGLEVLERGLGNVTVKCLYCGKIYTVTNGYLSTIIKKDVKDISCGCKKNELISKNKIQNLQGQIFDGVEVIETLSELKNHSALNKCLCSCGKIFYATSLQLKNNKYLSCGCKSNLSKGAYHIKKLLESNNIDYITEYMFPDLLGDKFPLKFDFALFNQNKEIIGLIEVNGRQHYEPVDIFGGEEEFIIRQRYDKMKIAYCENNNIPLFIIPYSEVFDITIDNIKERFENICLQE